MMNSSLLFAQTLEFTLGAFRFYRFLRLSCNNASASKSTKSSEDIKRERIGCLHVTDYNRIVLGHEISPRGANHDFLSQTQARLNFRGRRRYVRFRCRPVQPHGHRPREAKRLSMGEIDCGDRAARQDEAAAK